MSRYRFTHPALVSVLAAALALAAAGVAQAAKGQTSLGGNFGVGIYSNSDFNNALEASGSDEITSGTEFGGSIRHGISPRVSLDLEVAMLKGSVDEPDPPDPDIKNSISATPVIANLYVSLAETEDHGFNVFFGAGPLLSAKLKSEQQGFADIEESKTGFYAHAGLEGEYKISPSFGLNARAMGRMAKASDIELSPTETFDVDFNGAAFGVGARFYFGAGE